VCVVFLCVWVFGLGWGGGFLSVASCARRPGEVCGVYWCCTWLVLYLAGAGVLFASYGHWDFVCAGGRLMCCVSGWVTGSGSVSLSSWRSGRGRWHTGFLWMVLGARAAEELAGLVRNWSFPFRVDVAAAGEGRHLGLIASCVG
jgi:hypothetical protein